MNAHLEGVLEVTLEQLVHDLHELEDGVHRIRNAVQHLLLASELQKRDLADLRRRVEAAEAVEGIRR